MFYTIPIKKEAWHQWYKGLNYVIHKLEILQNHIGIYTELQEFYDQLMF